MKRYLSVLTVFLLLQFLGVKLSAKKTELSEPLPIDPKVKIGKLDNGLTYYIRENKKPENRVEFRLAVNAGSILEDESQLGLAHFAEHMAFNGSEHFEKNELISFLQSIGVDFGPDLNAYTGFDETVYMLTIPSDSIHLVEKGFLVMQDWAQGVTYADEDIDNERGVIVEEWRLGRGANQRMLDKYLPVIFKDSRYAERLPIGKKDIIENFEYETIRRFYRDWYRPDLMAFMVVGDIDASYAEKKIKEHFSKLTMPKKPKERKEYDIPGHKEPLVSIATDKEASSTVVRIIYKHEAEEMKTGEDYLRNLSYSCFSGMLSQRLQERTQEADPPFVYAGVGYGGFLARSTDAYSGYAMVSDKKVKSGLEAMLIENERVLRHGFTQGELDRFKLNLLKSYERSYAERDKTESARLVDEYIRHYLEEEAIPGIEFEYEFVKNNIDKITLEDVNKLGKQFITEENKVILVTGPDKIAEGLKEDQLLAISEKVRAMDIKPYEDNLANSELLKEIPKAGGIKSTKKIESVEVEKLTLSNGVEVYLKKTDFKNDEILLKGFSKGGTSVYPDEDFYTAMYTSSILSESGVSDFSKTDLKKLLAGKSAGIGVGINKYDEVVSGSCRPQDIETMFQLLYLKFTSPRKDEQAYQSYVNKMKAYVANIHKNPQYVYGDKYARIKYQNHKRGEYMPLVEDFDKINHERAMEIYQDRLADANDFIFVIVGNFDENKLKDMLSTYVATLPVKDGDENYVDLGIRPPKGLNEHSVFKGEDPKSMTQVYFEKEAEYSKDDAFMLQALSTVLDIKFTEKLREEMSGVYSVRASAGFGRIPYGYANMTFKIPSAPDNVDSLVNAGLTIVKDIQEYGVSDENITKVKNILKRKKEKSLETNGYWLNTILYRARFDKDFEAITDMDKFDTITSEEIQRVAKKYFNMEEYLQVTLYPEAMKQD